MQDPWHILETSGAQVTNTVKMACVLTLPTTGSESNNGAVISRKTTGDKLPFFSPYTFPLFAVLDPVVTYSLPPRQVANGVVDAFMHTVEQYLTYPVDAKVQDRFSEGLLLTLIIDGAIAATRAFFEKMGVPTHIADYQLDGSTIPTLVAKLKEHGMTALGEHADITPEVSQKIYEAAR